MNDTRHRMKRSKESKWVLIVVGLLGGYFLLPPIAKLLRPDPFPSFKEQITVGMTIAEVKKILGEPAESERLRKLVKVPTDSPIYDHEGNSIDDATLVKAVEGDLLLRFKIRGTNLSVIFDEDDRVKQVQQTFDIRSTMGDGP